MSVLKRIAGVIGLILGILGLALAVVQVVGVWSVNPPVTRGLQDLSGGLQSGLSAADTALVRSDALVQDMRSELQVPPDQQAALAKRLGASVTAIDSTLQGASTSIQTMQALFGATNRVPLVGRNQEQSAAVDALARAEQAVDAANSTLDTLEQEVASLAQAGEQAVSEIDTELQAVQSELAGLQTQIREAQATLATIEAQIPWWVDLGTVALTLIFVWYGVAQWCLLFFAWRWIRQPG